MCRCYVDYKQLSKENHFQTRYAKVHDFNATGAELNWHRQKEIVRQSDK